MILLSGSISGTVIDSNSTSPIKGVKVNFLDFSNSTNSKGEFNLKVSYESGSLPPMYFSSPNYKSVEYIPFNGNGEIKSNFIIKLEPTPSSLAKDKTSTFSFTNNQINSLTKDKKDFQYYKNKKIVDVVLNISTRLTPFILSLTAEFGVTGVPELITQGKTQTNLLTSQISCPTNEQLSNIISRKNKITKQLNNSLKVLELTSRGIQANEGIIVVLTGVFLLLKFYPVPTAVGGVGLPISAVNNIQDLKEYIKDNLQRYSSSNKNATSLITLLQSNLISVLEYLSVLDSLIQHCSPDSNITQEVISTGLTELTQQQTQQQSPIVTNVNGFEMGVETEITTNSLKRRRAIARNKQGVVMLKGEWSFSSVDQILIDELVFYIQVNNLKAD